MGECLQSRLDKLGQMRVLDMHAHLAFLTGSEIEKWEQKKNMTAYEAGKKELDFRYQNGIATCLSSGTPAEWAYTRQFQNREELLLSFGIHPWYADRHLTEEMPEAYRENLIVLDGTTGQNALSQLKEFKEAADVTGIILTKMDGTAKGGIAVAIQAEYGIPVKYIGVGEHIDDLQKFNSQDFVNALFDIPEQI